MDFPAFHQWLNIYPFVRTQIRESMMPKIWNLKLDYAVKQTMSIDIRPALIFNGDKDRGPPTPTSA